ncbi:unnamed protein product [Ilex paraguariensis]|uniref:PORR domain-containing protein n=1 Tax=Ilex paraguariensis TaxID=185542 RepID=A0ABC8RDY4_9AQUA
MQSILRTRPKCTAHHHRTFSAATAAIKCVRDRGLDHAVEKERNLKAVLKLKNFIKSEPSKSLPLSNIAQNKDILNIPIRPIDFIRRYPSIFQEFLPGGIGIHPHVKLTPEILDLDAEENLIYQSETYKQEVADRLLKLLMIARVNKIPLNIIDSLELDMGLPQDYRKSIVPEFPDYFQVVKGNESMLELVCWNNELAVSGVEKKAMCGERGMPIAFPVQYSRGFELDKKYKKWVDDWQKLPYISPYENAFHLAPKSDESDKWAVAVLHEVLNLFVPRKVEWESILCLGEYLGLRSRFKRALLHHPGIFYMSSKIGTHTVVLREVYKRDLLIAKHPLMTMRFRYIHLMNMVKENHKSKSVQGNSKQEKMTNDSKKGEREELDDDENGEKQNELCGMSVEDISGDDYDDDDDDDENEDEDESIMNRGRATRKTTFEDKRPSRAVSKGAAGRYTSKTMDTSLARFSGRVEKRNGQNVRGRSRERLNVQRTRGRSNDDEDEDEDEDESAMNRGRRTRKTTFEDKRPSRAVSKSAAGRYTRKTMESSLARFSGRVEMRNGQNVRGRLCERLNVQRTRGRSFEDEDEDESAMNRGRTSRKTMFEDKKPSRAVSKSAAGRYISKTMDTSLARFSGRVEMHNGQNVRGRPRERLNVQRTRGRSYDDDENEDEDESAMNRGRTTRKTTFEDKRPSRAVSKSTAGRYTSKTMDTSLARFSGRVEMRNGQNVQGRSR